VGARLASPLITGSDYGTRCSTVVAFSSGGGMSFEERTRGADGGVVENRRERLQVERV
jgi:uncharacterized protein with NRDE domain